MKIKIPSLPCSNEGADTPGAGGEFPQLNSHTRVGIELDSGSLVLHWLATWRPLVNGYLGWLP